MRSQFIINILALALLSAIALGFAFMPRYNFRHVMARIATLEAKAAALESGFEKVNILAGPDEAKRAAVVGKIDFIAESTKKLEQDVLTFLEATFDLSAAVDGISRRQWSDMKLRQNPEAKSAAKTGVEPARDPLVGTPKPPVPTVVRRLSPRGVAQMTYEGFLEDLEEKGNPLIGARLDEEARNTAHGRLRVLFSSYCAFIELINQNETLLLEELVEKATRTGDYIEERDAREGPKEISSPEDGVTIYVKFLPGERKREFWLPTEKNPQFRHLEELRVRALESFLALAEALLGS